LHYSEESGGLNREILNLINKKNIKINNRSQFIKNLKNDEKISTAKFIYFYIFIF